MSINVETDLKEILTRIDNKLDKLTEDVTELKVGQAEVKGDIKRLDFNISTFKEDIKEIKGSQKAQIWTLIGILITAVGGFIVAVGRSVLTFNP